MPQTPVENFRRLIGRYLDQLEYIKNISEEAPFFPQHIHIEPTNSCNLRCIHCIQEAMTRKRGMMSWETYIKVIDEIAPLGCAITLNVQGEPLLHPKIVDFVAYAKDKKIHVSLLTNGTKMSEELATKFVELKLDRIVFSFEGDSKEVYEKIRLRGRYEPTLRNILGFIKINHETGHHTHVCISAVMSKEMLPHVKDFESKFRALPVDKIFLNPMLTMSGAAGTAYQIDLKKLQDSKPKDQWPICRIPWEDITVNWNGEICLCPVDFNVNWSIGNVKELSLNEMWNNTRSREFRKAHLLHNYDTIEKSGKICSTCNCLWQEEYNIVKDYKNHIKEAIVRQAKHFAGSLTEENKLEGKEANLKYTNLLILLDKIKVEG